MRLPKSPIPLVLVAAAPLLALMQGCLYAGGRTVREVGPRITEESVAFIEPGRTSTEMVIAAFGEPNNRVCTKDGCELLRYDCDVRTTEGSYVFMLIASSSNTIDRTCWWFETRGDTVQRVWSDRCKPVTSVAGQTPLQPVIPSAAAIAQRAAPAAGGAESGPATAKGPATTTTDRTGTPTANAPVNAEPSSEAAASATPTTASSGN
jgi:hypothetical protein